MRLFKLSTALTFVLALAACVQGPLITSFNASDTTVAPGTAVTLSWSVGNPGTLTLMPGGNVTGQNEIVVTPTETTLYELTATKGSQSETRTVEVVVIEKPQIKIFRISPNSVSVNEEAILTWDVANAASVTISPNLGIQPSKGTAKISRADKGVFTYTLTASNNQGEVSANAVLSVGQGPTINFFRVDDADSQLPEAGGEITLSWQVSSQSDVKLSINKGVGDVTGQTSKSVSVRESTTYTLTATDDEGTSTAKVTVSVGSKAAITEFVADDTTVVPGSPVTLSWQLAGAQPINLTLDGQTVAGDTITVNPTQNTKYVLKASNATGEDTDTVQVNVGPAPVINTFKADDSTVTPGSRVTLNWSVSDSESLSLEPFGSVSGSSQAVTPTATTDYTLRATNTYGMTTAKTMVKIGQTPVVNLSASPSTVAPGGTSSLSWNVTGTTPITLSMNNGINVSSKGLNDSVNISPSQTTSYTLTATNEYGTANVSGVGSAKATVTVKPLPTGDITLLIAGQSNASSRGELGNVEPGIPEVRMLGNDYVWKQASEPTDSNLNQVDKVSKDTDPNFTFGAGHSFGVRLGKDLHDVTGKDVFLIQSAKGGSCLTTCEDGSWSVPSNRLNRNTLFGSANYRAQVSAGTVPNPVTNSTDAEGGPVTGIIWYQGESEQGNVSGFIRDTSAVMDAFQSELNDPPIIYAQIARRLIAPNESDSFKNVNYQNIREKQRLMETQYGNPGDRRDAFYMVVTHDLPMIEHNHLSAEGQKILGDRIALAYQEHVLGQGVDGTGPRLESGGVTLSGNVIKVNLDRPVNDSSDYEGYFNVSAGGSSYSGVGGNITSITRDPSDPSAILVTVNSTSSPLFLRYMPPSFKPSSYPTPQLQNVVKSTDTGLPLPAFGPLKLK